MELDFVKLHGLGNDFVFFEDFACELELSPDAIARVCDRHFGIGADGVIVVRPPKNAGSAGYMHYINADGTLAQMCGNGVRCFAKYLVDQGFVDASTGRLAVDTLSGTKAIEFAVDESGKLTTATVDMGRPVLDPALVPVRAQANARSDRGVPYVRELGIGSPWGEFAFTCVSMGNPHALCFIDDFGALPDEAFSNPADKRLAALDLGKVGAYFESHERFPEKTNVEFASVGSCGIDMRVYERGCGETLACGTGSCALAVAAALTGRAARENNINLLGGTLHIRWADDDHVLMTGPATEVFRGSIVL